MNHVTDLEQAMAVEISTAMAAHVAGQIVPSTENLLKIIREVTRNHLVIVWGPEDVREALIDEVFPHLPPTDSLSEIGFRSQFEKAKHYLPYLVLPDGCAGEVLDRLDDNSKCCGVSRDDLSTCLTEWIESAEIDLAEIAAATLRNYQETHDNSKNT